MENTETAYINAYPPGQEESFRTFLHNKQKKNKNSLIKLYQKFVKSEKNEEYLQERITDLVTISGTQRLHQFIPKDENYIFANEYSIRQLPAHLQTTFAFFSSKKQWYNSIVKITSVILFQE